jgi:hypothetical protein
MGKTSYISTRPAWVQSKTMKLVFTVSPQSNDWLARNRNNMSKWSDKSICRLFLVFVLYKDRWLHCIWFSEKCTKTKKNAGCLRQPVMELRLHFDWRLVVLSNGSHLYHFIIDFFPEHRNQETV